MVVVMIIDSIVVEPGLDTLGEILVMIHGSILALPQARLHRGVQTS
jgi:hypothetical protein